MCLFIKRAVTNKIVVSESCCFYSIDRVRICSMADMRTILRLIFVTGVFAFVCGTANGQQLNPNRLPLCPKDQTAHYHNCWGIYVSDDGAKYVGEFKDNKYHGKGTYAFASGDNFDGSYKDGKRNGQGTYNHTSGDKYTGEFRDGKEHGQGTYT